jgi:urease accessory protein
MASLHALLLLSDTALPLGSFAFSSGLESFLAHKNHSSLHANTLLKTQAFSQFLTQSISNITSTSLPYVLSAYHNPEHLPDLDNDFDASTPCTVARRASITQGRALLAIWERALVPSAVAGRGNEVTAFANSMKSPVPDNFGMLLQAHFPPLFGAVCAALGLTEHETCYLFLLNHAKTVLSAAVRASVMGPYQSQAVLASSGLKDCISGCIEGELSQGTGGRGVDGAVVTVPTMDLWMGRHELLYSRIFNS